MARIHYPDIHAHIKSWALQNPDRILISVDGEEVSYSSFIRETDALAAGLTAMHVCANQKIALIIPNSVIWYKIFWAIVKTGAQPVPLDPQIGQWEMERLLGLLEITVCFAAPAFRANKILDNLNQAQKSLPLLKTIIPVEGGKVQLSSPAAETQIYLPGQDHALMYACSSGSTGNPKVIVVPYRGFYKAQQDMADYLGFTGNDVMLLGMPLYHQGGFGMGLQMVLQGGTVLYQTVFDPIRFLELVQERKITVIQLTSTLAKILLSAPRFDAYDLSGVRICYFAGEVLPMEIARIFFEKLNIRVINIIGSSETATMVVWDSEFDRDFDVNDFRPLPFTRMKILNARMQEVAENETGTLFIHTDALITEYYGNEAETALRLHNLDGVRWFNTGDLGVRIAHHRIRFAGREKRIIKRGANLVYPEEIEAFLLTHPGLEAVAVIGEKHELFGEMITAYLQPVKGHNITRSAIARFCRGKLAAYKVPDRVIVTDAIPHDIGKVQFRYIRGND